MRIVSLVPSLTELTWWLGRGGWLAGRTRFCLEPAGAIERVPALGGTKDPDVAAIIAARPDLVIANREENRREDIEALREAGLDVLLTDPNTVEEALAMVTAIGERLEAAPRAAELVADTRAALERAQGTPPVRVFVPIWRKPLMGLGSGTYGGDLLERCGAINVLRERPRYPAVSLDEVTALRPGLILLPDEPYRFQERHLPEFEAIAPARMVDGRWLWWYGPRMPAAIRALRELLAEAAQA